MPKFEVTRRVPAGGGQSKLQKRVIERPEGTPAPLFGVLVSDDTPTTDWTDTSAAPEEEN